MNASYFAVKKVKVQGRGGIKYAGYNSLRVEVHVTQCSEFLVSTSFIF